MNQATGQREVNTGGLGPRGVPEPEAGVPQVAQPQIEGPQSVGAAGTPTALSQLTPQQAAEYGSTADKQWLYKSFTPGEVNDIEYVKGISPTMAQREQTANAARDIKDLRNLSQEAAQAERVLLDEHNTLRKGELADIAGSDVTQGNAIRAADQRISDELGAAFRQGGQVDLQPVVDQIETILNSPQGKQPAVKAVLGEIRDSLNNRAGTALETDPQQAYGARRVINYYQSKLGKAEKPGYGSQDAQQAMILVKQAIDNAIEPVAPGFQQAIANYAEAQRAIEARETIQDIESKIYDSQGRMQFGPLHNEMKKAVAARDPQGQISPYKSINEEQWTRLKNLHDDLMRVQNAQDLAKAFGSDTTQNLAGLLRKAWQGGVSTLAGAGVGSGVAAVTGPITGTIAGATTAQMMQRLFSRGAQRRAVQDMNAMLRPDPAKYPVRPPP
jgi:hypothetical protein